MVIVLQRDVAPFPAIPSRNLSLPKPHITHILFGISNSFRLANYLGKKKKKCGTEVAIGKSLGDWI